MSEQQNVETVRRAYEAFGQGDLDTLLSVLDEQVEWITPGPPEIPVAGRVQGRTAVAGFFKTVNELFDIQQFETKEFIGQGDRVVVLGHERAAVRSTGAVVEADWVHVYRLKGGRITSFQEFNDTAAYVAALRGAPAGTA